MDVEKLSKEVNQTAQPVTEQKSENKPVQNANTVSYPKPPVLQVDLTKLDEGMLATAESFGIPITAIIQYVDSLQTYNSSVEARLQAIIENFEPAVQKAVMNMAKQVQQAQQTQIQPTTAPLVNSASSAPTGIAAMLLPILQNPQILQALTGTVQSNPQNELYNQLITETLKAKVNEIINPPSNPFEELGKALVNQITAKAASKAATELGASLAGT